jgi:hypothetical protein
MCNITKFLSVIDQAGSRGVFFPQPHTTVHAGPHTAVHSDYRAVAGRREERVADLDYGQPLPA